MSTVWEALARALSPVEDRPRIAPELESAAYRTRGGAEYVVVHNPAARAYARLDPREFELLDLMDGTRSIKELVIAYYQRYGVLALARVAGLVRLLRQQHLLAEPSTDVYADVARQLRASRRQPSLRFEVVTQSVDHAFAEAYRSWGHVFFTRGWLIVGLTLGALGPTLVAIGLLRGQFTLSDPSGWGVLTIIWMIALTLVALAVHELGHGLAVKHAGRRVHQAGLRFYFGFPAAFVDTTDVWMARPAQRLLTAFAGPWTGLVLGGLCAIGAIVLGASAIGTFLFTAACVFLVDNLFNFNPLLELDGYYMLIDFLDQPLLRARSLTFVRGPLWPRFFRLQPLTPEERLLTLFGLSAVAYSLLAIGFAVRAWQALLFPLIADNLKSNDLPRQLFGLLILLAIAVPLLFAALGLASRAAQPVRDWLGWLSGRAAEHRHREALAALRAVPLWSELPSGRLLEVARAMRAENVGTGTEIIRQGEAGDRFYLVARGAFEVLVDDKPRVRLGRGEFFGERALLGRVPRAATVVAMEPGRLFVLERADFETLLASDLEVRGRVEAALAFRDEVAAMPLFRDLSPGELDVLLARLEPITCAAGETIIRQGESGERFYVVRAGQVVVSRDERELARLGPGEAFGEIALLFDVPRTASVMASQPTTLLALDAPHFRDVLAGYLGRGTELERLSHLRLLSHKRLDELG